MRMGNRLMRLICSTDKDDGISCWLDVGYPTIQAILSGKNQYLVSLL